jgi:hypothetical protein
VREWNEYERCKDRIKTKGSGNCEAWAFDYWKCVDKCVRTFACGVGFVRAWCRERCCSTTVTVCVLESKPPDEPRPSTPLRLSTECRHMQAAPKIFAQLK